MIRWAAALGILGLAGCTSVKLVQRENCWVKKTEKWPGRITEELGPCAAPSPPWSEDRVTRSMQECVARADHRWQTQAQLAWSRGEALPAPSDEAMRACLEVPASALAGDNELLRRKNDDLQERMTELARDRDALRSRADEERARREASVGERLATQERMTDRLLTAQEKVGERLFQGQDALAGYLGEAAKKSSQPAVATATATSNSDSASDGTAATESAATAPAVATPATASAPARTTAARTVRRAPACPAPRDPPASAGGKPTVETRPQPEFAAVPAAPASAAPTPTPTPTPAAAGAGAGAAEP